MIWSVSQGTVQDELLHAFSVFRPVPSLTPLVHGFPGDVVAASRNGCHSWRFSSDFTLSHVMLTPLKGGILSLREPCL